MKILLITQGVSRVVTPILGSRHDVVGILESAPRGYKHNLTQKILFLVRKVLGTFNKNFETLKMVSRSHGIPYRFMTSSDDEGLCEWVREKKPDLIVVFSMSQLLKNKIFDLAKYGAINLHPSYLPAYRGPNPDFWQYVDMEMRPGITVHHIDMGEDTGPIILQDRIELELGTKSPDRLERLISELGVNLLLEAIDSIDKGRALRVTQPLQSPTPRARNLKLDEHKKIICWEKWPPERIWHLLRGTELWFDALPQPQGLMYGQRWIIGDLVKTQGNFGPVGLIGKFNGYKCVFIPNGLIYLSIKFSIKRLILKLLGKY